MMKYLQKLGKALMLPVAALPICGILMGLGYALAPAAMGAKGATEGLAYTIGFILIKAGGALIDNMAWLFAVGAAVGLSDDHDGTSALAGLRQLPDDDPAALPRRGQRAAVHEPDRRHFYLRRL